MQWLDDTAGQTPGSAYFIEATEYQHDALRAAWQSDRNGLRLTVSSFEDVTLTIHEGLFGPYPEIGTQERLRMIEQALARLEKDGTLVGARNHASSISELFRKLEADGVLNRQSLTERLDATECPEGKREAIVTAYKHYHDLRGELAHPDARPRNAKLSEVATTDRSLQEALPHCDAIVVSGMVDPSAVELAVLERIADDFPVLAMVPVPDRANPTAGVGSVLEETITALRDRGFELEEIPPAAELPLLTSAQKLYRQCDPPETPPERVSWHEAPTPDREIRHLARELREQLATGDTTPDDVLVLAPALLSYREGIEDIFEAYGIDHTYQVSILLERTYVGQAMLTAIDLCERPRNDRLGRLLANPVVDCPGVDPAAVSSAQRRLNTPAIEPLLEEIGDSQGGLERLLERVRAVQAASPAELVLTIQDLLEYLGLNSDLDGREPETLDARYEARAGSQVQQILDTVDTVCRELSPDAPLQEAATALEGVRVSPPAQVTDNHVEIVGLQDTPMADFEDLYVLGATADHLSGSERRPRYFQTLGEGVGVLTPDSARDQDRYRWGMLIANATRVHVTTPASTSTDDPLLESPFVDELARVTGIEPTSGIKAEGRGCREDLQRAMAGGTPDELAPKLTMARENQVISESIELATLRGARCGAGRAADQLRDYDGQLSPAAITAMDERLTREPYSHSRLSMYATCGFKYLLNTGWEFESEGEITPGPDRLDVGNVIHETVERFFKGLQPRAGVPIDLTAYEQDELEDRLLDAGKVALEKVDADFSGAFGRATLERLFAGLGSPADNPYYDVAAATTDEASGTFVLFLETEIERAEEGFRPTHFEAEVGQDTGVTVDGRTVPVHGYIDRVDTDIEGTGVTIFDYKSSQEHRVRSREDNALAGIDFQLPAYLLGAPELFDDDLDPSPSDIAARYYILNDEPEVKIRGALADRGDPIDGEQFVESVTPDRIDRAKTAIAAGAFQPTLVRPGEADCQYCDYSEICDVRYHRRYDIVSQIDTDEHPAYVPDGARPEDITDLLPGDVTDE